MERYPQDLAVGIDDFRRCNWETAIASSKSDDYHDLWRSFSDAARTSIEEGKVAEGKVLWLLADACSLILVPASANEPFTPARVLNEARSALSEDFQQADIDLFSVIIHEIDHPWLQARLGDLVWLLAFPRSPKHALMAIDAYRRVPLDTETWVSGGRECWERAISLTRMLGSGAGNRMEEIETEVISVFEMAERQDGFLAVWLSNLLAENHLARGKEDDIAGRLESLARQFDDASDLHEARKFFAASAKWFQQQRDRAKAAELTALQAEVWVKEAAARTSSDQPSYMAAASFYENAIQTYRTIPRIERPLLRVDERISELHELLNEAGAKSLEEMAAVSSGPIDITQYIEIAQNAVRGKPATDALAAFANIHSGVRVDKRREAAKKSLHQHPLQALVSATHMSGDGRVIAKRPGMDLNDPNSDETKATIWAQMVQQYTWDVDLVVRSAIWPALEVLKLEHRLRERDFVAIAARAPIVPTDRGGLFGKALFTGYENDFASALHLLVPQLEHMVRYHLKAASLKTTILDQAGIENELGLSALMELPGATKIFGEDLSFELKALFCDAFGPNLRNLLAHGLLNEDACGSVYSIYAWWLGLRLVFKAFWNSRRAAGENGSTDGMES